MGIGVLRYRLRHLRPWLGRSCGGRCYTAARSDVPTDDPITYASPIPRSTGARHADNRPTAEAGGGRNRRNELGCHRHEAAAGGWRPLRTPDPALEPKMRDFIFGERNGIHIIDLAQTVTRMDAALEFVRETIRRGDSISSSARRAAAQESVPTEAERCGSTTSTTGAGRCSPTSRPSSAASSASRRSRRDATPGSSSASPRRRQESSPRRLPS